MDDKIIKKYQEVIIIKVTSGYFWKEEGRNGM